MPPTSVLEDPFLMGFLKWSEIEDLLCLEVFPRCHDMAS